MWIASHNLLHAPLLIAVGLYVGRRLGFDAPESFWIKVYWFALGCGIHSAIDIATHFHDGPLLLFPRDVNFRFESPISYWDPRHYGRIAMPVEHGLDLAAAVVMLRGPAGRLWTRLQSTKASGHTG